MSLNLRIPGFSFSDLYDPHRLAALDGEFVRELEGSDPELAAILKSGRSDPDALSALQLSDFLVRLAPHVSRFVEKIFPISGELDALQKRAAEEAVLSRFKRDFLVRRVAKAPLPPDLASIDVAAAAGELRRFERTLFPELPWDSDEEIATARMGIELLELESAYVEVLKQKKKPEVAPEFRARSAALARLSGQPAGNTPEAELAWLEDRLRYLESALHLRMKHPVWRAHIAKWPSFQLPEKVVYESLVETIRPDPKLNERREGPPEHRRRRDGFKLTDPRMNSRQVNAETYYCLLCHEREKDSCSKGFVDSKTETFQKNPLGVALSGCPLDEKISEMHQLRRVGDSVAALAMSASTTRCAPEPATGSATTA